jgi:hypothetical protein
MLSLRDTDRFLPFNLGPTAAGALQEFIDIDVTADDLVRLLQQNRAYHELFSRFVQKKMRRRDPDDEDSDEKSKLPAPVKTGVTHRLVGLLGMIGSRNLILCLRMNRAIYGSFPLDESGNLDIKTSQFLKYSVQAEEYFQRNGLEYSETAYAAGMFYDWISFLAKKNGSFKRIEPLLDITWKQSFRAGVMAFELARRVPGQVPKVAMAAAILAPAGKIIQAEAEAACGENFKAWEADRRLDPAAKLILEREKHGFAAEEVSAHALIFFSVFRDLGPIVRHYREPYVHLGRNKNYFLESTLVQLAHTLAAASRIPNGEADAQWAELAPEARKDLGLTASQSEAAMRAAANYR